jgi:hypothetical protein
VVQHKPARHAGKTARRSGSGAERGVRPHSAGAGEVGSFCPQATDATPSRLTAEQGRYTAAAGHAANERLAERGAASACGLAQQLEQPFEVDEVPELPCRSSVLGFLQPGVKLRGDFDNEVFWNCDE